MLKKAKNKITNKIFDIINEIKDEPEKLYTLAKIISLINFIVAFIMTYIKTKSVKYNNLDKFDDNLSVFIETVMELIFNKVFLSLFIGIFVLYLLINFISYFKSKNKSKIMTIFIIFTIAIMIIDTLFIILINFPNNVIINNIVSIFIFNLTGKEVGYLVLGYFSIAIICILIFLGIYRGKESVIGFISTILINTIGICFIAMFISLLFLIASNLASIVAWLLAIAFVLYVIFHLPDDPWYWYWYTR